MKLYFASAESKDFASILDSIGAKRRLVSFFYLPSPVKSGRVNIHENYGTDKELFLDSGAYSAFTKGVEIEIADYIRFIKDHDVELYANLDDIKSWKKTAKNQQIMERVGLEPLPAWHMLEPFDVLEQYAKDYEYVAIGFGRSKSAKDRGATASSIFEHFPDTKFHMFAITQPKLMIDYPFYSVDSTTWLNSGKYGALITPWQYVNVGKSIARGHFSTFSREDQIRWQTYLMLAGFNIRDILKDYDVRLRYSAKYFLMLEAAINSFPQPTKRKRMLNSFFKTVQRLKRWF